MSLAPQPGEKPAWQSLLTRNAVVLYTIANFAGTERHVVSFSFNTPLSGWTARSARVRVLVTGVMDAQAAAAATLGETNPQGFAGGNINVAAAAATAAAAPIAAGDAALQLPLSPSPSKKQHVWQQRHTAVAGHQQQQPPPAPNRTSQPLPWRALHHLSASNKGSASSSQAPAYLLSAFLDTRPMMQRQRAKIAVIMAVDKRTTSRSWKCLLRCNNSDAALQSLDLTIAYSIPNNEAFFNYQASTSFCELPQVLQDTLLLSSSLNGTGEQLGLSLTVSHSTGDGYAFNASLPHTPHVWVPVEVVPVLTTQQRQQYLSGEGSVAVCTPPVHTDAYAATLIGWLAFHKRMGVKQVTMYSFNPGPLIKPLMDFYAAQGFLQVHEWIIPSSILERKQQECLLPFFHASSARTKFDSPRCTYHQDNYAIAHWGQTLAIQDCVYRAMAARHRWVAVLDLDEYILPKAGKDWHAMLQQLVLGSSGVAAAEYMFAGVKMCSGCLQQQQQSTQTNTTSAAACQLGPTIGFHHITWPSTVLAAISGKNLDYPKTIVDPMAVGQASVHSLEHHSPHSLSTGRVAVQQQVAVKMHDRVHDIHRGNTTFAARMLPLLKTHIAQVTAATTAGRFDQQSLPLWPSPDSAYDVCGSVSRKELGELSLHQDLSFCSLIGQNLHKQIRMDVAAMVSHDLFNDTDTWGSTDPYIANLYGGHSFDAWAPPQQ